MCAYAGGARRENSVFHVRLWLRSGAVVEFEAAQMNVSQSAQGISDFIYESPKDDTRHRLGWVDVKEIAALVVSGSAEPA